jgi:hypothetical protein
MRGKYRYLESKYNGKPSEYLLYIENNFCIETKKVLLENKQHVYF